MKYIKFLFVVVLSTLFLSVNVSGQESEQSINTKIVKVIGVFHDFDGVYSKVHIYFSDKTEMEYVNFAKYKDQGINNPFYLEKGDLCEVEVKKGFLGYYKLKRNITKEKSIEEYNK